MTATSVPTVRRALAELKVAGVLVNTRTGKASRYEFPPSRLVHGLGVTSDPSEGSTVTYHGPFEPGVGENLEEDEHGKAHKDRT